MDKERSPDLMLRGRSSASRRFSPARRHPMHSSSPIVYNGSDGGDRERYGNVSSSWKKEKVRGSRSRNNEAEGKVGGGGSEGDPFRPPLTTTTTNNVTTRKRVRLHGKTSEDCDAVDPASVPRKLRSAINKRSNQSASPPLPDTRKKRHRTSNDTQLPNDVNKSEQTMSTNSMTKDEEEVAETLFALANMMPTFEPVEDKEDQKASEDMSNINATNASHSEGSVHPHPTHNPPHNNPDEDFFSETAKAEPALEHPVTVTGSPAIEQEPNKADKSHVHATLLLSKIEHAESTSSMNTANQLKSSGASSQYYSGNGSLQPTQNDALPALPMQKPDIVLWPFGYTGSAALKHELQPNKQRTDTGLNVGHREETDRSVCPGLPSSTQVPLTMLSTSKTAAWPGSATSNVGLNSTGNGLPTEERPAMPLNVMWLRKRCATHVYLTHLIRRPQNMERKSSLSVPPNQSKSKEGSNMGAPAANETAGLRNGLNCMASAGTNGSLMERNVHEARMQMLHSERLLRAQQAATLSETYAPQKQTCDILSLSAGGESSNPGSRVKLSGQPHYPFMHPQASHHSVMPFGFPHVPHMTPYPEKLSAAAAQQLQLPQYMGSTFYGPQMVHAGGTRLPQQQHQQPIWPTYLAHYRPPMGVPVRQNGRLHDMSRQPRARPPASAAISPSPAIVAHTGAYHPINPPQQQHLHVNPSLSSSSRTWHHLNSFLDNGGFLPEVTSPLQLLCNAQRS
ncbi:uncharacterized protein [Elaeis guineensis]|uniref:Uncharacterized protein LOC105055050 isoform X2 n=1 Tax=Elaeis guineensis var. tenera TaxID=51953 RepID=A0A6I9RZ89_ELAGV|nr:uncharacterized protein LOC105055050 isoform X2 [Elaeis guineensis]